MAIPAVTYTFVNGQTSDGPQVSQNFSDLINSLTDGTKSLTVDDITCDALTATGNVALGNAVGDSVTIAGTATVGSTLGVTGATTLSSTLTVGGVAAINARSLTLTHNASSNGFIQIVNSSSGDATLDLAVQGAGDPYVILNGSGISNGVTIGLDNSDSETLKIGVGAVGSDPYFLATAGGALTLGAASSTATHTIRGNTLVLNQGSGAFTIRNSANTQSVIIGGGDADNRAAIELFGGTHATQANKIRIYQNAVQTGEVSASGAFTLGASGGTQTHVMNGKLQLIQTMTIGGAGVGTNTLLQLYNEGTFTLTGTSQWGISSEPSYSSSATVAGYAFYSQPRTEAASFTLAHSANFYAAPVQKGAGSTITRATSYYCGSGTGTAGNSACIADNTSYSGDWFINQTSGLATRLSGTTTIQTSSSNTFLVTCDAGSDSSVNLRAEVPTAATTGDATFTFTNTAGATAWTIGRDTSASATFKIAQRDGNFAGVNEYFTITSGGAVTIGSAGSGNFLQLNCQADPGAVTDGVRLGSVDISAGNASLSLRTETAVVSESVTSDRTLQVQINGTTYKLCLKA